MTIQKQFVCVLNKENQVCVQEMVYQYSYGIEAVIFTQNDDPNALNLFVTGKFEELEDADLTKLAGMVRGYEFAQFMALRDKYPRTFQQAMKAPMVSLETFVNMCAELHLNYMGNQTSLMALHRQIAYYVEMRELCNSQEFYKLVYAKTTELIRDWNNR